MKFCRIFDVLNTQVLIWKKIVLGKRPGQTNLLIVIICHIPNRQSSAAPHEYNGTIQFSSEAEREKFFNDFSDMQAAQFAEQCYNQAKTIKSNLTLPANFVKKVGHA